MNIKGRKKLIKTMKKHKVIAFAEELTSAELEQVYKDIMVFVAANIFFNQFPFSVEDINN